jgi:hypothetical protein
MGPCQWSGLFALPLSAPGQNERLVSGCPAFIESRFGPIGVTRQWPLRNLLASTFPEPRVGRHILS